MNKQIDINQTIDLFNKLYEILECIPKGLNYYYSEDSYKIEIVNDNIIFHTYDHCYEGYPDRNEISIPISEINNDIEFFKDKYNKLLEEKLRIQAESDRLWKQNQLDNERSEYERLKKKFEA